MPEGFDKIEVPPDHWTIYLVYGILMIGTAIVLHLFAKINRQNKKVMRTVSSIIKIAILVSAFAALISSCRTTKNCGDYYKWESKTKFRSA